mmetsp:Transcript_65149/g.210033  ORF Transcript_65149/g.210033 Transcript_65149/m.210033 type:complete len:210 (-) Transcript_65149:345-974(-)
MLEGRLRAHPLRGVQRKQLSQQVRTMSLRRALRRGRQPQQRGKLRAFGGRGRSRFCSPPQAAIPGLGQQPRREGPQGLNHAAHQLPRVMRVEEKLTGDEECRGHPQSPRVAGGAPARRDVQEHLRGAELLRVNRVRLLVALENGVAVVDELGSRAREDQRGPATRLRRGHEMLGVCQAAVLVLDIRVCALVLLKDAELLQELRQHEPHH